MGAADCAIAGLRLYWYKWQMANGKWQMVTGNW